MKIEDFEKSEQQLKYGLITSDEAAKLVYTTGENHGQLKNGNNYVKN